MGLVTVPLLKLHLGITDGTSDVLLAELLCAAEAAVKSHCKRNLESTTYTEYYDGNGRRDIPLRQWPVSSVTSVYEDAGGYYGQGEDAFPATSLLTAGESYALIIDQASTSKCGLLRRLGLGLGTSNYSVGIPTRGSLAGGSYAIWSPGSGNLKVTYVAGYTAGSVPADLKLAVIQFAIWLKRTTPLGGASPGSESLGEYSYSLATEALSYGSEPTVGSIRGILSRYMEPVL